MATVRLNSKQEAEAVLKVWKETMTVGEQWAVLDSKWWRAWLRYSGVNTDRKQIGEAGGQRPGAIDNSGLQESKDKTESLRIGIQEGEDFAIVPKEAWELIVSWYGGGPAFIREVVAIGIQQKASLDLFPFVFNVVEVDSKTGSPDLANVKNVHVKRATTLEEFRNQLLGKVDDEKKDSYDVAEKTSSPLRFWIEEEPKKEEKKDEAVEGVSTAIADVTMTDAAAAAAAAAASSHSASSSSSSSASANGVTAPGGATAAAEKPATNGTTETPVSKIKKDGWALVEEPRYSAPIEVLNFLKDKPARLLVERKKDDGEWPRKAYIKDWRDFQINDIIDARDTVGKWYESSIRDIKDDKLYIHFIGWASTWDEWLPITSDRLAAKNTYTLGPKTSSSSGMGSYSSSWDYGGYGSNEDGRPSVMGGVGLRNLGNTCFMNSTLQCMSQTPLLTEYFVEDKHINTINRNNPLGWQGRIADEYGALLKEMWSNKFRVVAPRKFKQVLGEFAPRFSGYQQQDSSELLSFLLDGLHEDLNQVKSKPPTSAVESNDRADEVVAKEAWDTYLKRNQSIVVDWLQGQLKSKLVCPKCGKVSITFDPFMFLSVPLPTVEDKVQHVHFVAADPKTPIRTYGPTVSKVGRVSELKTSLEKLVGVSAKRMVVAEIWQQKIYKFFEEDASVSEMRSNDVIVVYEVPSLEEHKAGEAIPVAVLHQRMERNQHFDPTYSHSREFNLVTFGVPRVIAVPRKTPASTKQIRQLVNDAVKRCMKDDTPGRPPSYKIAQTEGEGRCFKCGYSSSCTGCELENDDTPFPLTENQHARDTRATFCVQWYNEGENYNAQYDSVEKDKSVDGAVAQKLDCIELFDCIKAFTKEEILSEQDPWYCSKCKDFRQASKKFDIWKLPEILVIHLKRFSYTRLWRDKISTLVDFPLDGLDLAPYVASKEQKLNAIYDLYAVSNHMGGMGGGHYTAYCKSLSDGKWYCHDDSRVSPVTDSEIKSDSAYVLFYHRRGKKDGKAASSLSASSKSDSNSSASSHAAKMSD